LTNQIVLYHSAEPGSDSIAVLKSIDGSEFSGGIALDGPLVFFSAPAVQPFAAIEGTITTEKLWVTHCITENTFAYILGALEQSKLVASSVYRSTNGQVYVARTGGDSLPTGISVNAPAPIKFIAGRNF